MGPRPRRILPAKRQFPLHLHRLYSTQPQTVTLSMTTALYARSVVSLLSILARQEVTD
jgi:hypothetical protein